jgi:hypothetical protein
MTIAKRSLSARKLTDDLDAFFKLAEERVNGFDAPGEIKQKGVANVLATFLGVSQRQTLNLMRGAFLSNYSVLILSRSLNLTDAELDQIAPVVQNEGDEIPARKLKKAVAAWREVKFGELCNFVVEYYKKSLMPLFSYPHADGSPRYVPLYVESKWTHLHLPEFRSRRWKGFLRRKAYGPNHEGLAFEMDVVRDSSDSEQIRKRSYQATPFEQDFLNLYSPLREQLGLDAFSDNRELFRLVELENEEKRLRLVFEKCSTYETLMCQVGLEHESLLHLHSTREGKGGKVNLPVRRKLAKDQTSICRFFNTKVARIGISNLLLFRCDRDHYFPVIGKRASKSMQKGVYDTVSSGFFDITSSGSQWEFDFDLPHKVLKEIGEELFGMDLLATPQQGDQFPDWFYKEPFAKDLLTLLKKGSATFNVSGFCVDLIRLIPEITTVLVVNDLSYYKKYHSQFRSSSKYSEYSSPGAFAHYLRIPRRIVEVDKFFATEMLADPIRGGPRGFDPARWSLVGGFCLYQGLKRAVADGLLK